ncbi:hypothetical protein FQV27_10450 [Paracoccus aurantiacus]|uniref:histidine kinase n=1 Tax=Paracoccus aurantiacus TaxID=2599412 RepID=A0A5C6S3E8_9RHOB|nr:histidine kinase dimerization/phospho-acceptor domain-containing protein [Paracoccus aurantiacus]TXB69358.1 hypothetical protein FQV27_10450 [Paracoccus aurantiacus]
MTGPDITRRKSAGGWSLRGRLLRRVLIGVGLGWLLGLILAISAVRYEMGELLDESLGGIAQLSLSIYRETGDVALPPYSGDTQLRIIHNGDERLSAAWPALAQDGGFDVEGWRVVRISDPASGLVVEAGQNDSWRREEVVETVGWLVVMMLPVLALTLLVVSRAVTSALRPTDRFARQLQARKPGDLDPIRAPGLPRDLAPVAASMNLYLDRIRGHVEAERQFATHAAHELRTPVAAASAQAQAIAAGIADTGAPQRIVEALRRLGSLVDRLLLLARADAAPAGLGQSDLVQVTRMVIAEMRGNVVFDDGDVDHVQVAIHPEALALILGNLLRNARDHGSGAVRVALTEGPVLTISNPIRPGEGYRHAAFEKSARTGGTGLGLDIVRKIAGKEGIGLEFDDSGNRARVTLIF